MCESRCILHRDGGHIGADFRSRLIRRARRLPALTYDSTVERMVAAIWKGSLAFGLVNVPVELKAAVRGDRLSFRQRHEEDLAPIKYERVSSTSGEPVPWGEIVKGYEYAKGKFVVLTDEDFTAAAPEATRSIEILDFVKAEEIDWRYFETPYYLVPGKGGEKAYALLREAIRTSDAVGVGKIVLRSTQHLAGIRVVGDALVLELMRFSSELVDAAAYDFPSASLVRPQELRMAEQLVENLAQPFEPEKYTDDYREALMRVIRAKMKGRKIEAEEPVEVDDDTPVIDLMARLKASLDRGKRGSPARKRPAKRAAAKRPSARKKRPA
jgi:DNA end-binding protein Ku